MKKFAKLVAIAGASLVAASQSAMAALPTGVDTAITGASTDGGTLVGSLAVAGAAVFLIHKLLKRFGISM